MGVRPSDIKLATGNEPHISSKVQLIEPLGDITVVSVNASGSTLRMVLSESSALGVQPGHELPLNISPDSVHVFSKEDGAALPNSS